MLNIVTKFKVAWYNLRMNEVKKVLLCGLGAVGTAIACKIAACKDIELKVLVDRSRFEKYNSNPRIYNGKSFDFGYVLPDNADFKPDLVIVAVKFSGLFDVIENLQKFVSDKTLILSVLNGITADKILSERFGANKVLAGFYIGHSAIREGNNITNDEKFKLIFGSEVIPVARMTFVSEFLDKCLIDNKVADDIQYAQWCKFALNIVCNQLSAILKFDFHAMKTNQVFINLADNTLKEVVKIAKAEGVKNAENIEKYALDALLNLMDDGKTSMLQDVENTRKTEVDIFAGEIIRLGKKHGISTPYNQVFYELIKSIEADFGV